MASTASVCVHHATVAAGPQTFPRSRLLSQGLAHRAVRSVHPAAPVLRRTTVKCEANTPSDNKSTTRNTTFFRDEEQDVPAGGSQGQSAEWVVSESEGEGSGFSQSSFSSSSSSSLVRSSRSEIVMVGQDQQYVDEREAVTGEVARIAYDRFSQLGSDLENMTKEQQEAYYARLEAAEALRTKEADIARLRDEQDQYRRSVYDAMIQQRESAERQAELEAERERQRLRAQLAKEANEKYALVDEKQIIVRDEITKIRETRDSQLEVERRTRELQAARQAAMMRAEQLKAEVIGEQKRAFSLLSSAQILEQKADLLKSVSQQEEELAQTAAAAAEQKRLEAQALAAKAKLLADTKVARQTAFRDVDTNLDNLRTTEQDLGAQSANLAQEVQGLLTEQQKVNREVAEVEAEARRLLAEAEMARARAQTLGARLEEKKIAQLNTQEEYDIVSQELKQKTSRFNLVKTSFDDIEREAVAAERQRQAAEAAFRQAESEAQQAKAEQARIEEQIAGLLAKAEIKRETAGELKRDMQAKRRELEQLLRIARERAEELESILMRSRQSYTSSVESEVRTQVLLQEARDLKLQAAAAESEAAKLSTIEEQRDEGELNEHAPGFFARLFGGQ